MNISSYSLIRAIAVWILIISFSLEVMSQNTHSQSTNKVDNIHTAHVEKAQADAIEAQYNQALQLIQELKYEEARQLLENIIQQQPLHAGAWLDLAIVQCQMGNQVAAEKRFAELIEKFSPAPVILEIIAQQRHQACPDQPQVTKKTLSPQVFFNVEHGRESNVNQGASNPYFTLGSGQTAINLELLPEYLPKPDRFIGFNVSVQAKSPTGLEIQPFFALNAKQYDKLTDFNLTSGVVGLEKNWHTRQHLIQFLGYHNLTTLGEKVYQRQTTAQIQLSQHEKWKDLIATSLSLSASRQQYATLLNNNSTIFDLRSRFAYEGKTYLALLSIGWTFDQANEKRLGGSRHGWLTQFYAKQKWTQQLEADIFWQKQCWQAKQSYAPGLIDQKREQNTQMSKLGLTYWINPNQHMKIDYRHTQNHENISFLAYQSHSWQVSWNFQY